MYAYLPEKLRYSRTFPSFHPRKIERHFSKRISPRRLVLPSKLNPADRAIVLDVDSLETKVTRIPRTTTSGTKSTMKESDRLLRLQHRKSKCTLKTSPPSPALTSKPRK